MTELRPSPFAMPSHAPPGEAPFPASRRRKPHVSVSQLNEFVSCGHKFYLKRVRRVPIKLRPSWAMIGGKAVHETFDDVVRMRLKGKPEEAAGRFAEHLIAQVEAASEIMEDQTQWKASGKASAKWPLKENLDWWLEFGPAMARKFATIYDTPFLPGRVVEVDGVPLIEVEHLLELADPFEHSPVKGFIDAVVELPNGAIIPRDYKSGSMKPSNGIQLASYAAAMRDLYGIEPTTGEYLLTRGSMTAQTWDLSQLTRPVLTDLYAKLERGKEAGIFLPNPSSFCTSCEVRAACIFRKTDEGEEAVTDE